MTEAINRRDTVQFAADAAVEALGLALKSQVERIQNHWLNVAEDWLAKFDERGGDRKELQAQIQKQYGNDLRLPTKKVMA